MNMISKADLTAKDFTSDQEVRWCPGCGDYAILKAVRSALAGIGRAPDDVVFVSGIGCAARFPYYLTTYGFHTIHGRAPAVATGVKTANPDLDVWVVGGDGDFLSIGGNHLVHALRRNVDLNLLLINNAIYGLTKGQYSPTSGSGTVSASSPKGSVEQPTNAARLALGAGAKFIARSADTLQDHLPGIVAAAQAHKGAALVEVFQNCIVFNDGAFDFARDKATGAEHTIKLEDGQPLLYGAESDKGLIADWANGTFRKVTVGVDAEIADLTVHDSSNRTLAGMLADMTGPDLPVALGILFAEDAPEFTEARHDRAAHTFDRAALKSLLSEGATWTRS